jgi:hypothetical protein
MPDSRSNEKIEVIIGKEARVYKTGEALTEDFRPERVNIELSESNEIIQIWMG